MSARVSECVRVKPGAKYHVENGLGQVAVQFCQTIGKLGHVDDNQLIGVVYPVVKSRKTVEGQVGQVLVVNVLGQSSAVLERQLSLVVGELAQSARLSAKGVGE